MTDVKPRQRLFRLFADLLEYPQFSLTESVRECEALVSPGNPEAAALLHGFRSFEEDASLGQVQELYTRTFDLDATYHPYVGHHLFGESYKRSAFMVGLKERYKAYDFVVEGELPDHLAVLLRYLSLCEDEHQITEIVSDAMVPALEKMIKTDAESKDVPMEIAPIKGAPNVCVPSGGASCHCGQGKGLLDVSPMGAGAQDMGTMDVGWLDEGAPPERPPEEHGPEQKVYPELLHALRLVLQELVISNHQPAMNVSP